MAKVLGLDLGTNSIGWALLESSDDRGNEFTGLIDSGVRIFQEGVDRSTTGAELSKNAQRRTARGARKLHKRRNQRRYQLKQTLIEHQLLPSEGSEAWTKLMQLNPYSLRSNLLELTQEHINKTPEQWLLGLGRALYHMNQRRGFKSNRKTGESDGKVATALSELQQKIDDGGFITFGQYLYSLDPKEQRIRCRYTKRSMYEDEFETLWSHLSSFYPEKLTSDHYCPTKITLFPNLTGLSEFLVAFEAPFARVAQRYFVGSSGLPQRV
ncbi:MAG: hypothetical protein Q9M46_05055 [Ghiorsea sp.]|nr:hypothetical protein [Ghiorsea sp.]